MSWSAEFMAMTNAERLQEISTINDAVRTLQRAVIAAQNASDAIDISTQTFASGWQGTLITDIDAGTNGQTPGVTAVAEALEALFLE